MINPTALLGTFKGPFLGYTLLSDLRFFTEKNQVFDKYNTIHN